MKIALPMKKAALCLAIIGAGVTLYYSLPCLFDTRAAWQWRFVSLIAIGHVFCLTLLFGATPRFLFWLSKIPGFPPNWLSIQRNWIIWLGQVVFFSADGSINQLFAGFLIVAFGLMLDRIDGKMAMSILASIKFLPQANDNSGQLANSFSLWAWYRVTQENPHGEKVLVDRRIILEDWIYSLSAGRTVVPMFRIERDDQANPPALRLHLTYIGEWLDPLCDKFNFLPLFCYLVHRDMLYWPVVVPMVLSDLFSTVIREPFLSWPGFRRLQDYIRETKASPIGKTKVIWQITTVLSTIPAAAKWLSSTELHQSKAIASCLLGLAVIVGVLSTTSRLTLWPSLLQAFGLRKAYQTFKKGYDHDVEEDLK